MTAIKRILFVVFVLTVVLNQAYAVPAYRGWRTVSQPDGTTVTIRQMGDEFFHYWENEEGQQVEKTDDGWWRVLDVPAVQGERSKQKQASRSYYHKAPGIQKAAGQINLAPRGLVILVNFSDVTYKSSNTQSAMSDLMNSANYTYNSATGSVREFFRAQSNGAYVPDFDVVGPYTLANNRAHYGANDSGGDDVLPGDMVVEACKAADADGVDFTLYNNDGDSYVDFVYIIYAGVGEADSDVDDAIWPHNWTLSSARSYNNCTYTKANSKVDNLYIENYACSGELEGSATYRCPIGTIAHEFGHVLGLPDYYVTSSTATNEGKNYTPGAWHIMDYGSYNNEGRTPPNYSPHDKLYFGWYTISTSSAQFLAKDAKKNCSLTTSYGSWYQITGTTSSAAATSSSRVWYLEDRQKSGWDRYLPGHGMVVWEVQYNSSNWTGNTPNNSSVGYTLVTANSLSRPYKPCVYSTTTSSTSGTTFPGTSNVRSYTPATGCALTEITESGGNITFKYNGGADKTRANYEFVTDHCTAPADGDVAINAALSVTITPNSGYTLDDASCWTVEMGGVTLTYGSGFTYNASTNTFYIASLTDDVVIMAEAKLIRTVTWSVQGNTSTTTFADGAALVLPSTPSDCSDTGGKKFVGWTANSSVSGSAPADLFNSAGSKTVTANTTYYAVYADYDVTSGGGAFDGDTEGSYKIYAEVSGTKYYATGTGSKINSTTNEAEATEYEFAKVTGGWSIKTGSTYITYGSSTNLGTSASSYTWTLSEGSHGSWRVASGTNSSRAWIYRAGSVNKFGGYSTGNVNGTEYFDLEIGGGSSSVITYSDYSLTCSAPVVCALTGITLNTSGATTAFTTGDAFSSAGLVVTAHYSNCADATVTPTSISSPDMSTAGSKTITVSYTENGTTRTATYSITVSDPVTHTVTWSVNGTPTPVVYNDGQALALPATPSDCAGEGGKKFVGWTASSSVSGSAPADLFTEASGTVTADVTYYAVYATASAGGGGAFDGNTEGSYKIYAQVGETKYYAQGTGSKISSTTNAFDATEYEFAKVTGGWSIKTGSTYITYGSSTNLGTSTSSYTWTLSEGSHGSWRVASGTNSSRAWIYRAGSVNKFGGYSTVNVNGTEYFDLEIGGGSSSVITYSDYSLTCTDTPPVPTYTVLWKACGETFKSETYPEGNPLVLPDTAPEDNAGKSFVGWTTSEHYTGADAPTLITAGGAVNADVTYYAVFH